MQKTSFRNAHLSRKLQVFLLVVFSTGKAIKLQLKGEKTEERILKMMH